MAAEKDPSVQLEERINLAEELLKKCEQLEAHVEGRPKLQRKIKSEISFLTSLKRGEIAIKASHIQSTNLLHLDGVVKTVEQAEDVISLFRRFHFNVDSSESIIVDVVASNGSNWIKVIARNPVALHRIWEGQGEYGERDLVEQAKDFCECSKNHIIHFQRPLVSFRFCNGVTRSIATCLTDLGVNVQGIIHPDPGDSAGNDPLQATSSLSQLPAITHETQDIKLVNLDVSTMIAYVSAVTNGRAMFKFKDSILSTQAEKERKEPLLPKLAKYLEGKELVACQSSVNDFDKIVQTIGGPNEKERAKSLLSQIKQVPDNPSERALSLKDSASIKLRSKTIFGTGDKLKAVTITANSSFVRAASSQGVNFSVFLHDSRALTEAKECQATPIVTS